MNLDATYMDLDELRCNFDKLRRKLDATWMQI